jgi:hypothetical protein
MKNGQIFARKSTTRGGLDLEYLDETSRRKISLENPRREEILASPQKLQETLSQRLDADKLVFSPKLTQLQSDALKNSQTADAIRLQQLYQSIRNLEAGIAKKRQALAIQGESRRISRLIKAPKPKLVQVADKIARQWSATRSATCKSRSFNSSGDIARSTNATSACSASRLTRIATPSTFRRRSRSVIE